VSETEPPAERARLGWPIWAALLVGLVASAYVLIQAGSRPGDPGLDRFARGSLSRMQASSERPPAPPNRFTDPTGRPVRIAELPGRVKVVNIWATNCAPCKLEMPTLAALQGAYPGQVSVTPVSIDPVGKLPEAKAFIARHPPLAFHHDPTFAIAFAMKAQGMPTTVIYDAEGRERARVLGAAEWDSPEARALIDALLGGA
jgi:thiol-disulfide isomerase/thioredoxin